MRVTLVVLSLLAALPVLAEDPPQIRLGPGESRNLGRGYAPICDDPSVATISSDGAGVLRAGKPGKTVCSLETVGGRRVYAVVVEEPKGPRRPDPGGADGSQRDPR